MNANLALEKHPDSAREAVLLWRTLKDEVDRIERQCAPYKEKIKQLTEYLQGELTIVDGETKSETISVPGAATVYKKSMATVKVLDYEAFSKYLIRNGYSAAIRKQINVAPLQDLVEEINMGNLPTPQSAEFGVREQLTLRRIG